MTKLIILALALGVILFRVFFASLIDDWYVLMTPVLLLVGLYFFVKIVSERQTKGAEREKKVWMREELLNGALLGLVLIVGDAFSVTTPPPNGPNPTASFLFFIAPPLLCGIASFISSQRNGTVQAGISAGTLTAVIGMLILVASQPLDVYR